MEWAKIKGPCAPHLPIKIVNKIKTKLLISFVFARIEILRLNTSKGSPQTKPTLSTCTDNSIVSKK